jgi:hypothetical protein
MGLVWLSCTHLRCWFEWRVVRLKIRPQWNIRWVWFGYEAITPVLTSAARVNVPNATKDTASVERKIGLVWL